MKKYEEFDSNRDVSSVSAEDLEFRITPMMIRRIGDSFDSSVLVRNDSDISMISQISYQDESFRKINSKPLRQVSPISRPLSILKTTFLDDPANLPKAPKLKEKSVSAKSCRKAEHVFIEAKTVSLNPEDKIGELENEILKKDALIETLRNRVAKIVEELEETHRKANLPKVSIVDECRLLDLQSKSDDLEKRLQSFYSKEKELNLCLDKRDEEIQILTKELRSIRIELDRRAEYVKKLENELDHSRNTQKTFESRMDSLKLKLENSSKAIEMTNAHKNHLEQEVVRLEIVKRSQENEMKVVIEENSKGLASLNKKLQEAVDESGKYQKMWKDSAQAYETLQFSNTSLTHKLQYLEDQLSQIDKSIRVPLKERTGINNFSQEDVSQNLCENCFSLQTKYRSNSACSKGVSRDVMEVLGVGNAAEVVPAIKKLQISEKEKKLIRKVRVLVKECLDKDRHAEVSCSQIWRIIKKVFEEYAKLVQDYGNEIKVLRQYFGEHNLVENLIAMNQENKKLKDTMGHYHVKNYE